MERNQQDLGWFDTEDHPSAEPHDFNQEVLDVQNAYQEYFTPSSVEQQYPVQNNDHDNIPKGGSLNEQRFPAGSSFETAAMKTSMATVPTVPGEINHIDPNALTNTPMLKNDFDFTEFETLMDMDDAAFEA